MSIKLKPDGDRVSVLSNARLLELCKGKKGLRAQKARNELVKRGAWYGQSHEETTAE